MRLLFIACLASACTPATPTPSSALSRNAGTIVEAPLSCADLEGTFDAPRPSYLKRAAEQLGEYELEPGDEAHIERLYMAVGYRDVRRGGPTDADDTNPILDLDIGWLTGNDSKPLQPAEHSSLLGDGRTQQVAQRIMRYRAVLAPRKNDEPKHTIRVERVACQPTLSLGALPLGAHRELWLSSLGAEVVDVRGDTNDVQATLSLSGGLLELIVPRAAKEIMAELSSRPSACANGYFVRVLDVAHDAPELHVRVRVEHLPAGVGCPTEREP